MAKSERIVTQIKTKFVKVKNIDIPDCMFHPYKLDNDALNNVLSEIGGLIPSQVIMLTGLPGSGKTTLASYIGAHVSDYISNNGPVLTRPHGPVIFISREMSDFQIKLLSQKVGDFDEMYLITDSEPGHYHEWLRDIHTLTPSCIILDSVQKLASELDGSINKNQINIVKLFKQYSKKFNTPVILIGHVTKNGKYIGPSFLQHEVDSHLHISIDKDTGDRVIKMHKNRFGDTSIEAIMKFKGTHLEIEQSSFSSFESNVSLEDQLPFFHTSNSERKTISISSVEKLYIALLKHLVKKYSGELKEKGINTHDIKVRYNQTKEFNTDIKHKSIYIGFGKLKNIEVDEPSGYKDENRYLTNICPTKEDVALWYFLHEFCHFLYGTNHTLEFFQKVYVVAKDNNIFSSNLSGEV